MPQKIQHIVFDEVQIDGQDARSTRNIAYEFVFYLLANICNFCTVLVIKFTIL